MEILYRGSDKETLTEHAARYEEAFCNPFAAARHGFVDDVIMPRDTRRRVISEFQLLRGKVGYFFVYVYAYICI